MDRIEGIDEGAYAHFGFQASTYPQILAFAEPAYYVGSYIGIGVLLTVIVLLFLVQRRYRSVLVALLSVAAAVALIEGVRVLVPRARPFNADQVLGQSDRLGSYPSSGVFLFTLCMVLLGFAVWDLLRSPWLRGLYLVVAGLLIAWICMSGFFLSLHYVSDVIGGITGAALVSCVAGRYMDRAQTPGASEGR